MFPPLGTECSSVLHAMLGLASGEDWWRCGRFAWVQRVGPLCTELYAGGICAHGRNDDILACRANVRLFDQEEGQGFASKLTRFRRRRVTIEPDREVCLFKLIRHKSLIFYEFSSVN